MSTRLCLLHSLSLPPGPNTHQLCREQLEPAHYVLRELGLSGPSFLICKMGSLSWVIPRVLPSSSATQDPRPSQALRPQ